MNTTSKLMGVVQGQATSALADALGNLIKSTYITNVTWDSSTHTLAFWGGSVLKYSCVIELAPQPLDDPTKPLYLLSKQNGSTVTLSGTGTINDVYQTSTDNVIWSDYTLGTPLTLDNGEGIYFRIKANRTDIFTGTNLFVTFSTSTGVIEAYHNVNSMLSPNFTNLSDLTTVVNSGAFCLATLFGPYSSNSGVPYLTRAPLLPATTLAENCYSRMFRNCTGLTKAPRLPATSLVQKCYWYMFGGCTGLTQAPELPATTLALQCYYSMFTGCTSLTQAPVLSATALVTECYFNMFKGCTGLTQAPELPATSLMTGCYQSMFEGCTSLTQAPELDATTLGGYCYYQMFKDCTSLTQAPELPATTLTTYCYTRMFQGCTSLTQAPELPATTLAASCYSGMFNGCTSLTRASVLPATTLVTSCYYQMFYGCSSLNEVRIAATDISASSCLSNWLSGVSSTGNFYCEPGILYPVGASGIPTNWVRHDIPAIEDDVNKPLYFLSKQNGSTLRLANNSLGGTYQTSTDNVTWADYTFGTDIVLNNGEGVYFRIKTARTASGSTSKYINFRILSGIIEAYHNVLSLIHPTDFPNITSSTLGSLFYKLFEVASSDAGLYRAPLLPLTTIGTYSYSRMFYGCTHLTTPPALPATTIADHCYYYMFSGCTSLTEAPNLPATSMTKCTLCYAYMFKDCTRLVKAPVIHAISLVGSSSSNGGCSYMFQNCTSLSEIRIYATTNVTSYSLYNWLNGASSSGDFYCVQGVSYPSGTSGKPTNWTRHDINDYPSA